jgi:uncharacterized tellurite resistance protein B-like protein
MNKIEDGWTVVHDLALIYISLAYGTDQRLGDRELNAITSALSEWNASFSREQVQEIVIESAAVFLEKTAEDEVVRSIQSLGKTLSPEERERALEQIMSVAEADGVLMSSERSIVSMLAEKWGVKDVGDRLLDQSTSSHETSSSWTLMHDISLIYIIVAHSTDNDLSRDEINAIIERLGEWQPDLNEAEIRSVMSDTLQFYKTQPDNEALSSSVRAIRDSLPVMQRLALLDDLVYIARSDGELSQLEKEMITNLSKAWQLSVRLDGSAEA